MVELLISMVLINLLKTTTKILTKDPSLQVILNNQSQETLLLFRFHLIMVLVTKLILQVMSISLLLKNQRQISLNMQIMTKRFSDILLDSTQKSQRMLIEDSLFHSTQLTIQFPFSNLLRRILVLSKDHSWREESTRMLIRVWSSSLQPNFQLVEILKSMVITSIFQDVMIILPSTLLLILTDYIS